MTRKSVDYLADLYRQWLSAKFNFPSYCAYEKRSTRGILIVNMASASALCTRALDPIDTNHIDIVKPENQNSASYIAFKAAYADAEIPNLKDQLDNKASLSLKSEIAELAQFPNGANISDTRTVTEGMMGNRLPIRMFGTLEHYKKAEILGVPGKGEKLYQFKIDYYDFQSKTAEWETDLTTKIGQLVKVRFRDGWQIYLRYVLLRFFGQTQQAIIDQGNFLNYEITWDDAERVFTQLSSDPALAQKASTILATIVKVNDEAKTIAQSQ